MKKFLLIILFTLIFTISCARSGPSGISPYAILSYSVTEDSILEFYEGNVDVSKITLKLVKARDKSEELLPLTKEIITTDLEGLTLGKNTLKADYHGQELKVEITIIEMPHEHNYCQECGKCIDEECDGCICNQDVNPDDHILCSICTKCINYNCPCQDKCPGHKMTECIALCNQCGKCIDLECDCNNKCRCYGNEEVGGPIIFNTVSGHSYLKTEIENAFRARTSYNPEYNYSGFANYIPEEISREFNIAATIVYSQKINDYYYYIYYNNKLYNVDRIGASPDAEYRGFVQFAITDLNQDGFIELIVSYHLDNNININYLSAFDTKSEQMVESYGMYDKYAFFKMNGDNLAIYTSKTNDINNADTHYSDIVANNKKYVFANTSYHVACDTYEVDITIDEYTINFPLLFKGIDLRYQVNTAMTYLGSTFIYTNGTSYLDGAVPRFGNIQTEAICGLTVVTKFVIFTGMVINNNYQFLDSMTLNNSEGTYDMNISYRFSEEEITIEDVLTIQIQ